ncbi:MAG: NYN domain-containing protein [Acidimicrobiales bacterium]
MAPQHIVVDGSNIATEGRSAPSLKQLEEAVAELKREHPGAEITVIVDATFAHRIDPSELDRFETAALAGEYVHPPAGAIGRGDAFLLRVAEKVDATVLSNDSFQEFHGEHPWVFERGRLLGATPVPGIGWIFSPRTPVRGPTSRQAVREAERATREVTKAIKVATKEAVAPPAVGGPKPKIGDRRVMRQPAAVAAPQHQAISPAAVNDPLTFVSFIAEHPLGAEVTGRVDSYTSHGAVVMVGSTQCYVPLANLAHPPPRSAREVLTRGEDTTFVVRALDPQRRGVELALPGVGTVSGTPSEEMIEAEVRLARKRQPAARKSPSRATKTAGVTGDAEPAAPPAARTRKSAGAAGASSPTKTAPADKAAAPSPRTAKAAAAAAAPRRAVKAAAAAAAPPRTVKAAATVAPRRTKAAAATASPPRRKAAAPVTAPSPTRVTGGADATVRKRSGSRTDNPPASHAAGPAAELPSRTKAKKKTGKDVSASSPAPKPPSGRRGSRPSITSSATGTLPENAATSGRAAPTKTRDQASVKRVRATKVAARRRLGDAAPSAPEPSAAHETSAPLPSAKMGGAASGPRRSPRTAKKFSPS